MKLLDTPIMRDNNGSYLVLSGEKRTLLEYTQNVKSFFLEGLKQELVRKHKEALQSCKTHNLSVLRAAQQRELEVKLSLSGCNFNCRLSTVKNHVCPVSTVRT